jgi:hypothetical protein
VKTAILLLLFVTLCTSTTAFATDRTRLLTLEFQPNALKIAGVTPGATVFIYGLAREAGAWTTNVVSRETRLNDGDQDGAIHWNFEKPLPWRSIWLAVELGSGKYGAGAPAGYPARRLDLTGSHLGRDKSGAVEQVSFTGTMIECLVIRPGDGNVWGGTIMAGSSDDRSTEQGTVTFLTQGLQPHHGTTIDAPAALEPADVVLVLNSFSAEYGVAQGGI